MILQIALDTPLRRVFDYLPPTCAANGIEICPRLGVRVRVPFGRQRLIGILVGIVSESVVAGALLWNVVQMLRSKPDISTPPASSLLEPMMQDAVGENE